MSFAQSLTPTQEAFPEVHDAIGVDQSTLAKMLDALKVLSQYQASFNDQKAVCQAQIKSLLEDYDIALDARYPLQSFTQKPTSQNLSVANEAVLAKIGHTIAEVAKRIWEIISKLYDWVVEAIRKLLGRQTQIHRRVMLIKILREANEELTHLEKAEPPEPEAEAPPAELSPRQARAKELVDANMEHQNAIAEYDKAFSSLALDLLTESPLVGVLKVINLVLPHQVKNIDLKLKAIQSWLKRDDQYKEAPQTAHEVQSLIGIPLPLPKALENTVAKLHFPQPPTTLAAYMKAIHEVIELENQSKPVNPMEWKIAAKVIIDPRTGFDEPVLSDPIPLQKALKALKDEAKVTFDGEAFKSLPPNHHATAQEILMVFLDDILGVSLYLDSVRVLLGTQADLVFWLWRCEVTEFEYHKVVGKNHGSPKILNRLNNTQAKLRTALSEYFPDA